VYRLVRRHPLLPTGPNVAHPGHPALTRVGTSDGGKPHHALGVPLQNLMSVGLPAALQEGEEQARSMIGCLRLPYLIMVCLFRWLAVLRAASPR
jgi:hypothetical protein